MLHKLPPLWASIQRVRLSLCEDLFEVSKQPRTMSADVCSRRQKYRVSVCLRRRPTFVFIVQDDSEQMFLPGPT
jgi:hypothetical protein